MAVHRDVEHFDRWAPTYDDSWAQRYLTQVHAAMLDTVAASLPTRPKRILDIGCGTGRLLRGAAARWPEAELIGVDPAARMVEMARRLLPAGVFEVAPAEELPFSDATADLVLSSVSFHHWTDQRKGLAEAGRVLRCSGRLCLADIALPGWVARLLRSRARSAPAIQQLLEATGFRIETQERRFARTIAITSARKLAGAPASPDQPRAGV